MELEFTAISPDLPHHELSAFRILSLILVIPALLGVLALSEAGETGHRILFVLCSLGTIVALSNCLAVVIAIAVGSTGANSFVLAELLIPCAWTLSYWYAYHRLRPPGEEVEVARNFLI